MTTFENVRSIVANALDRTEEEVTPASSLTDDLAADSLDVVQITMALEDTFGLEFDEEVLALTTVQEIVDYVEARSAAPA